MNHIKRADLKALPRRKWDEISTYDSLLIVPSGKKHDSGYGWIEIVGCKDQAPIEVAACCDDICWHVQGGKYAMRTDMLFPSNLVHVWGAKFEVGRSLSSTDIRVLAP